MGIYIKGMKLEGRPHKALFTERDGKFVLVVETQYSFSDKEIKVYPVEELPPHGRLIDADAILKSDAVYEYPLIDTDGNWDCVVPCYDKDTIKNAPTIIPAEEGELDG